MEWSVVTVIVVLVGLFAAIAGPIIKLNSTITKLSTMIDYALKKLDELEEKDGMLREERKASHEKSTSGLTNRGSFCSSTKHGYSF